MTARLQLHTHYILQPEISECNDYAVQAFCGNPSGKRDHTQLVRELSSLVFSAHCVTVALAKKNGTDSHTNFDEQIKSPPPTTTN